MLASRSDDAEAVPGGLSGASLTSSAADVSIPVIGSSDQPQSEPQYRRYPSDNHPEHPHRLRLPSHRARRSRQGGAPHRTEQRASERRGNPDMERLFSRFTFTRRG